MPATQMYILTVTPLGRGIGKESLSYYHKEWVSVGTAVRIPIRKKQSWGLVTGCEKVADKKANIKKAGYTLKAISKQKPRRLFLPQFVDTAQEMARLHASTTGAVLFSMSPQHILETIDYKAPDFEHTSEVQAPSPRVVHATYTDRPLLFRRLARETLATDASCYIITPTINQANELFSLLSRGIEEQSFLLHSDLSDAEVAETWKQAIACEQPILLVTTPNYLSLPRTDIGTFVIEKESDATYKHRERPYIDVRLFVERYAQKLGAVVHYADNFFRPETYHQFSQGVYDSSFPFSFRTCSEQNEELINMNEETMFALKQGQTPRTITIPLISTRLAAKLSTNITADRNTFLFVSRKGLAPQTICGDCGTPISCPTCKLPAMLHTASSGERIYACHHCQETLPTGTRCPTCQGWRMVPLGIGSEGVLDEVTRLFPQAHTVVIDSNNTKTATQIKKAYRSFSKQKGSILIGTELAVKAISRPLDSVVVISIDNRFSIPDYRIHEHTYRTLVHLRERSRDSVIIQTRHPKHPLFNFFRNKPYAAFYDHELEERKDFGYPPFTTLIRIGITEQHQKVQSITDSILEKLTQHDAVAYDALRSPKKGYSTMYILIKVPSESWMRVASGNADEGDEPYEKLLGYLRSLPPSVSIEYDPASIV